MTPGDRFNEVVVLVMGACFGRVCLSLTPPAHPPPPFMSTSSPPTLSFRSAKWGCSCLQLPPPSGNHCFMAAFCDEGFCLPAIISSHLIPFFVFLSPLFASKLSIFMLLRSLSLCFCHSLFIFFCLFDPIICATTSSFLLIHVIAIL